jgi:hypothetical protein
MSGRRRRALTMEARSVVGIGRGPRASRWDAPTLPTPTGITRRWLQALRRARIRVLAGGNPERGYPASAPSQGHFA